MRQRKIARRSNLRQQLNFLYYQLRRATEAIKENPSQQGPKLEAEENNERIRVLKENQSKRKELNGRLDILTDNYRVWSGEELRKIFLKEIADWKNTKGDLPMYCEYLYSCRKSSLRGEKAPEFKTYSALSIAWISYIRHLISHTRQISDLLPRWDAIYRLEKAEWKKLQDGDLILIRRSSEITQVVTVNPRIHARIKVKKPRRVAEVITLV